MKRRDLKALYNAGLISSKPFNSFEIKSKVAQYESQGIGRTESASKVAELLGVHINTVWNALKATRGITLD